MQSTVLFVVFVSLSFNSGEQGHFGLANASNQENPDSASSSCLWIIQLHYENNVRFTLDALGDGALLNLYPEDQLTSCGAGDYTNHQSQCPHVILYSQFVPTATWLFAATMTGLFSLDLQTLEAASLTSEHALAVAVNPYLKKIYWSELWGNSRIMRSNLNGSATEVIAPPTGASIRSLAVHEPSGNVYFSVLYSNEITVCNALGENCAAVISSSSLANNPWSIALDYKNNVMYWSNSESGGASFIRANLDGSNVTIISSGFSHVLFITLDHQSNDIIYWTDDFRNTIGTIDVNGSTKQTVIQLEGSPWPNGIQVDDHKIYFGNWNAKTIQSVDRDSGENLTTIFKSNGSITHLALFKSA